ncbi:MAG: sigma-70 family RNA polymerase sigma factor [Cyanobacteriota bacterium]|nr:sigma-70 family RNA polymerase sigma factor [Cyanobacteriota bacterium]MDY6358052.1 sigma-70 family RNA polymerase sigma factor [Cyanobacteriota bacterium]MDY6363894.1 sigma-70 family RNA polymerase sigma factor [Cyanobacteriota bacterium]
MSAEDRKLKEYKDLIEIIAKVEYQKFSSTRLVELPELINIGTHALYILFKNKSPEHYNNTYLSTAIKWAIRNEVRRRYKWYTLKNKPAEDIAGGKNSDNDPAEMRAEVYKNILSIDELQDAEIPTQIKSHDKNPEETIVFSELKKGILDSMQKLPPREKEFIECKFFQDKKLREIADEYNISQSRISRIIQSGLDKIKKDLAKQGII